MKKAVVLSVLAIFCMTGSIFGQTTEKKEKKTSKLGSLVRKVGEAATGINMSNETFAVIPFEAQALIDMEVVSCVGNSNTQDVVLTLAVKAKKDGVKTALGKSCGNGNQECVTGYDAKGGTYEGREIGSFTEISGPKENPAGIPISYSFGFSSIPSTLQSIEVVQVEFYVYADKNVGSNMSNIKPIQVRNIAITWE